MTRHIYILRGLPGSGREKWIRKNLANASIEYNFHSFVQRLSDGGIRPIAVVGIHQYLWQISPYTMMSRMYGLPTTVVTCVIEPETASRDTEYDLKELIDIAHIIRSNPVPEEWGVEEVISYQPKAGWFRPLPREESQSTPSNIIEAIRREVRSVAPSIPRIRQLVEV